MIQYIKKVYCWFINLFSNNNKSIEQKNNKDNNKTDINIISCKVRYIKEQK